MAREDVVTVFVTVPGRDVALELARKAVEESLAACGNVIPQVTSVYRWKGKIKEEEEVLLILKTTVVRSAALIARVAELHEYEVPEVLSLPVEKGFEPYLEWVRECTSVESINGRT